MYMENQCQTARQIRLLFVLYRASYRYSRPYLKQACCRLGCWTAAETRVIRAWRAVMETLSTVTLVVSAAAGLFGLLASAAESPDLLVPRSSGASNI